MKKSNIEKMQEIIEDLSRRNKDLRIEIGEIRRVQGTVMPDSEAKAVLQLDLQKANLRCVALIAENESAEALLQKQTMLRNAEFKLIAVAILNVLDTIEEITGDDYADRRY